MLEYVRGERDGLPIADVARTVSTRSADDAARAALAQLPGWLLASEDPDLIAALTTSGAVERRHAYVMSAALPQETAGQDPVAGNEPTNLEVVPLPRVSDLYPSWRRAYPPGHPDFEPGTDEEVFERCWAHLETDRYQAVLHRSSGAVIDGGEVIAGIIVDVRPEPAPYGGPWISDIWVDPDHAGHRIGESLIRRTQRQLAEDGHRTLGLVVTHGNPARRVYERTGFTHRLESWTVMLPADGRGPV